MDKAEQIIQHIVHAAQAMGVPVQLDRPEPVQSLQAPLAVVRTGEEDLVISEKTNAANLQLKWRMTVRVEVYISQNDPNAGRAQLNQMWAAFRTAFFNSPVAGLLANGEWPELGRRYASLSLDPKVQGQYFEMELVFLRQ